MDEFRVAQIFGEKTFRRGKDYYEEGRVLYAVKLEGIITGEVLGTMRYCTRVNVNDLSSICSCPVRINCKHGVALILRYLSGAYMDGDRLICELERVEKPVLLEILKNIIRDDPALVLRIHEAEEEPGDILVDSIEKQIEVMLKTMMISGYADEPFAESLAKLVKTNGPLMSKELILHILEFLVFNSDQYGGFYEDYGDYYFGDEVFENLADAYAQKPLETDDFPRLHRIQEEDNYDLFYNFITRMVTAKNAPKLREYRDEIKSLLDDEPLYVEFLINAGYLEEAKNFLKGSEDLRESIIFNLYLKVDKDEALKLAEDRKYYSSLIRYYLKTDEKEVALETFRRSLNEEVRLDAMDSLHGRIFLAIKSDKPDDAAELLSRLFDICYRDSYFDMCVEIGIELKNLRMMQKLVEAEYWLTPSSRIKLIAYLSQYDPVSAREKLESYAEVLINEKKDYTYDNAVTCIIKLKDLMSVEEWTRYLEELYIMHSRKSSLWNKLKEEGIQIKKEGNTITLSYDKK
jgi:hypothetical protein